MKKILILIIFIFLVFSCKKEDENEYTNVFGEIIYTDSFSPEQWENPISRNKIEATDKDIGVFIKSDVVDPKLRKISTIIKTFIDSISNNNLEQIKTLMNQSAYNSFSLRFKEINVNQEYIIRTGYPETSYNYTNITNPDINEIDNQENVKRQQFNNRAYMSDTQSNTAMSGQFWINFKILFKTGSIISKVEINTESDNFKITDFDEQLLTDLEEFFKK